MRNMKIGTKIILGFGLLVLISVILGGIAVYEMTASKNDAHTMSEEFVPEVAVANNIERYALLFMYEIRAYILAENKTSLENGRKHLATVNQYLKEAHELTTKHPQLTKLRENANAAETKLKEYEALLETTVKLFQTKAEDRQLMDASAKILLKECNDFRESQETKLREEYKAGLPADKLEERYDKIMHISDVIDFINDVRVKAFKALNDDDTKIAEESFKNFPEIDKKLEALKPLIKLEINIKQLAKIKEATDNYRKAMTDIVKSMQTMALDLTPKRAAAAIAVTEVAKNTATAGINDTVKSAGDTYAALGTANTIMIIGLAIATLFGIFIAIIITRSITKPLTLAIEGLTEGADQVTSAADQVSAASQELAEGSSEQAAAVEETSASLEEMTSMTRQNADNASQANTLMGESKAVVTRAGSSMKEMTKAMSEISSSGQEIGKIIKTIDEIAFQTNLLALNAAVEAARAGEAGAGFAVVADEVRNLAQRAAEAAKNTASLIEGTITQINRGTELVRTADQAFTEVSIATGKVEELVGEISAASNEQAQGIDQINQAMTQMDQVTQKNAANAEETASAAEELNAQSSSMRDIVNEMALMVGTAMHAAAVKSRRAPARARAQALPTAARTTSRAVVPAKARAKNGNVNAVPKSKVTKPDDIIPMNDDFKDF
ncbi:MAG: MCP four helix bundle domain-containing protein [Deltaproteobacteria bacterium]|nr:MCP four helix bundle domain-containing protein [Deltaproteobacteria bacterium]